MKNVLMTTIAIFGLALFTNAQVPNYIPTNGLVAWWPFNGNANDESLNGNNGTVNGATLTTDRFGVSEKAYIFSSDFITIPHQNSLNAFPISLFAWCNGNPLSYTNAIITKYPSSSNNGWTIHAASGKLSGYYFNFQGGSEMNYDMFPSELTQVVDNNWHHVGMICDNQSSRLYVDGEVVLEKNYWGNGGPSAPTNDSNVYIGKNFGIVEAGGYFNGKIDDIGIWNRALTQQEITDLYNAVNCTTPVVSIAQSSFNGALGSNLVISAQCNDNSADILWQANSANIGWQTISSSPNYVGQNTVTLSVNNLQLANHNQQLRVIASTGNGCLDTSNIATIQINDTCINTIIVYDTIYTTVNDTLVINTLITGLTPPNNLNTIKVFPNPSNDHITIDFGNFASMNGYTLKITNSLGQIIFTTPVNQQSSYIDLSTWGGNGIYFVQVIDTQNNTIENRKIVLQ